MASNRTVYHVVPNADQSKWLVTRENDAYREEHRSKSDAEQAAKERARGEEPSQVKVHLRDGNMEYESTYGQDPPETPG